MGIRDHFRNLFQWNLSYERVADESLDFGATLPNLIADTVGHLGEKITVGGAFVMRVAPDVSLAGYVHPRSEQNVVDGVATGHFAALVAYRLGKGGSEVSENPAALTDVKKLYLLLGIPRKAWNSTLPTYYRHESKLDW